MSEFIYGIHPVRELLKKRPAEVSEIVFSRKQTDLEDIILMAQKANLKIRSTSKEELDHLTGSKDHQGIIAKAPLPKNSSMNEIIEKSANKSNSLLVFLDQIEDPQNLGAIIRNAECAGADALIIPEHKSAKITPAVHKASAGALEWLVFAIVPNLVRAIEQAKANGFWAYGASPNAQTTLWETKFSPKTAIIIGSEAKGIRPLVQKTCDFQIRIPLYGNIQSLNAGSASAIVLYHYRNQFPGPCS